MREVVGSVFGGKPETVIAKTRERSTDEFSPVVEFMNENPPGIVQQIAMPCMLVGTYTLDDKPEVRWTAQLEEGIRVNYKPSRHGSATGERP